MKRLFALLIAVILCLGLVSCGSDKDPASSKNTSSGNKPVSSEEEMTSSKPEVDTRYRATREQKPDGFKYKEVKILVLGDSITAGDGTPSGYRYSLFEQLYASGARFQFVGPKKTLGDSRLTDKYNSHLSTGGWKIATLTEQVNNLSNCEFDIAVIMIGRNDANDVTGVDDRYKALLDAVFAKNPKASVYCSDVIPKRGSAISSEMIDAALNQKLPSICKEYTDNGKKTTFVQMSTATWEKEMYGDGVHPNEKGNAQIAKYFWDAILDEVLYINDQGDSSYVEPVHVSGVSLNLGKVSLEAGAAKTLTATVTPDNAEVKNVLWSSSDEKVATVNAYGKITAVAAGKATITAKSLDKNVTATCEVTVSKSTEPATTSLLLNSFNNPSEWTGDIDFITSSGFATSWATCNSKPKVTFNKEIKAGKNFKMNFNYRVSGNPDSHANSLGGYSSIQYAGYEIRVYNCVRTVELYINGSSVGKHTSTASQDKNFYTLKVLNGKTTLSINGEEIISVNSVATAATDKKIYAAIGDYPRCCTFSSISIHNYQ